MNDQLQMFPLATCEVSSGGTFSAGSADGRSHSASPDGLTTAKSGQARRRANRSASPAKELGLTILGIYGPTCFSSCEPSGPLSLWVSKSMQRLAKVGSTECMLTWKDRVTPSGRSVLQLVPSTPRIVEIDCGGALRIDPAYWITATTRDWKDSPGMSTVRPDGGSRIDQLPRQVAAAIYSTPRASDGEKGGPGMQFGSGTTQPLPAQAYSIQTALMVSPTATDGSRGSQPPRDHDTGIPLSQQAVQIALGMMPTPTLPSGGRSPAGGMTSTGQTPDGKKSQVDCRHMAVGITAHGSSATTGKPAALGSLNPEFVAWLMMGDLGSAVLACAPESMPKSPRCSRKASSRASGNCEGSAT